MPRERHQFSDATERGRAALAALLRDHNPRRTARLLLTQRNMLGICGNKHSIELLIPRNIVLRQGLVSKCCQVKVCKKGYGVEKDS